MKLCYRQSPWNSVAIRRTVGVMRLQTILALWLFFILPGIAIAQTSKTDAAVEALRRVHPATIWNVKSARVADVDCDSKPDTIVIGLERGKVAIGIVWGNANKQPQVLTFPIRRDTQDGFCAVPSQIETSPLDCRSEAGTLPGCKVSNGCQAFSLRDDECDPFNFYWDAVHKKLAWWRM